MVHEGIGWFHDANAGSPLLTMTVTNAVPRYLSGSVNSISGEPIPGAQVAVPGSPAVLRSGRGVFADPTPDRGMYTLTARADGYSTSLPAYGLNAALSDATHSVVLVPGDWVDAVTNGDLEDGLAGWEPGAVSAGLPSPTTTSHTGLGAVQLGPSVLTGTAWLSQTAMLSGGSVSRTLSLLYRVSATDGHASLQVTVTPLGSDPISHTLPVTVTDWTHFHVELPAGLTGPRRVAPVSRTGQDARAYRGPAGRGASRLSRPSGVLPSGSQGPLTAHPPS